jgi:hypothetical protein
MSYTGRNLAAISGVICCATRTQDWGTLGTEGGSTQEEVQMMQVGADLFIACNYGGHVSVNQFLTAFGVDSPGRFSAAIKWTNAIISSTHTQSATWARGDVGKRSKYSTTEETAVELGFPADISDPATLRAHIAECIGVGITRPERFRRNWKIGPFEQLLACYSDKTNYNSDHNRPPTAHIGSKTLAQSAESGYKVTVINSSASVHAELKLLSFLARMIIEGKVTGADIYLGGLKAACRSCAAWITTFQRWLTDKGKTLHLPADDTRPSAGPVNWNKPTVAETIKTETQMAAYQATLFD